MALRSLWLRVVAICVFGGAAAYAQTPDYGVGKPPKSDQIRAWDINITNSGSNLPPGSGTADVGDKIYAQKCAMCHGQDGSGGQAPALANAKISTPSGQPRHVFPKEIPYATVMWDYIRRAMPMLTGPGTLKPDEVYALTAYLLYRNDIIKQNDVMDAQTLPRVKMPNRAAFVPPPEKSWKH